MSKTVLLKPYNHKVFYSDRIFKINNGHNAFYRFDAFLRKKGYEAHTLDYDSHKNNIYIYADMPYPWDVRAWATLLLKRKSKHILIVLESPIINPFNQWKFLQSLFDSVLSWNAQTKKDLIAIPQLEIKVNATKSKTKMLVFVNANKNVPLPLRLLSFNYKNLYNKRIEALNALSRLLPEDFDIYGRGWADFTNSKGEIAEGKKVSVMSQYRFALCFENTIKNGYITEKIFDCFKSNVIPVYLGAQNVSSYIPESCYIDFRKFNTYTELVEYLQNMPAAEYSLRLKNIQKFLKSSDYMKWSQQSFFLRLLKEIKNV